MNKKHFFILIITFVIFKNLFSQNYALEFDGINDAVYLSNSTSFQSISNALTIEARVKADKFDYDDAVFMANNRYSLQFTSAGAIKTGIRIGSWTGGNSNSTVTVSQWTHIALTYDGDKIRFYINGNSAGVTDATDGIISAYDSSPLSIGANYDANANYFNGKIDEIRIWNISRSQTQIQSNMNKTLTGNESGLVAYYNMNSGSGTTLIDNCNNSNTGSIFGATWILSDDVSLSVDMSSFSARTQGQTVILEWVTESELDNLGFILERSDENNVRSIIASYKTHEDLKGQGSISNRTEYKFIDKNVEPGNEYFYHLSNINTMNEITINASLSIQVDNYSEINEIDLVKAYPNPFNPQIFISYRLSDASLVKITVHDMQGRLVKFLFNKKQSAGNYQVFWNGTNEKGIKISTGNYIIHIETENISKNQKVLFIK